MPMDMLDILKKCSNIKNYTQTQNYYYESHNCPKTGNTVKVQLDFTLANDVDDEILRFGVCKDCGECYCHKDFQSKGW